MKQPLIPLSHRLTEWKHTFPSSYKGIYLPGSHVLSSDGEFGSLCVQEYHSNEFSIRVSVFDLMERFVARAFFKRSGIYSRLLLKGRVDHDAGTDAKWSLHQSQFSLISKTGQSVVETYEKSMHISFDACFSVKLAKELLLLYPSYTPQQVGAGRWTDFETIELVHSILNCKYDKELRPYFFKSRIKDLLFKYLQLDQQQVVETKDISENEIKAIHDAAKIIQANVAIHYSIPDLSKKVLLNEFRFKSLFKKILGIGPYEYLVRKRMEKAKELLETGLSIKEVAVHVGYRASDFTTVFRNHFGVAPSKIKRNR